MESLIATFNNASLEACDDSDLMHDVMHIIECFEAQSETIDIAQIRYKHKRSDIVYNRILAILSERNMIVDLLEMFPYIDDYLEYIGRK